MIPQFILDTVFEPVGTDAYFASTKDRDGWVIYWPSDNETFHTYRYPPDWYEQNA